MGIVRPLRVGVRRAEDRVVLSLEGELDLANAPALEGELDRLQFTGAETLVLDLERVEFIDSTGLRTMLAARERCEQEARPFAVTPGSQQVQRLLTVTRMGEHLNTIAAADAPLT